MKSIFSLEENVVNEDPYLIDDGLFEQAVTAPSGVPQDVLDKLSAIDQGLEAYGQLCHIAGIVSSNEKFDPATIAMARIAMESIKKPLGIFDTGAIVAVESFTSNGISVEGFSDTLNAIWQAIVRTFKAIRDAIMGLIRGSKVKQHAAAVETIVQDVKVAKQQAKAQPQAEVFKPTATHASIRLREAAKHFAYLGYQLKPMMLISQASSLDKALGKLDHLSSDMVKSATGMRTFIDGLDGQVLTGKDTSAMSPESNKDAKTAMNAYFHGILNTFSKGGDLRKYADVLLEKNAVPFNKVTHDSIMHLEGMTRGITIFAYCTSGETMRDLAYKFFISPEEQVDAEKIVVEFDNLNDFELYCEVVHSTFQDYVRITKDYETRSNQIFAIQDKTLQKMDTHLRSLNKNQRELQLYLASCREITRVSSVAIHALNSFMMVGERSLYDHSALLRALHTLLKPEATESQ